MNGTSEHAQTQFSSEASQLNDDATSGEKAPSAAHLEASFTETYKSLESMFGAKRQKFTALKSLASAEAKLSFSAILLIAMSGIALFVVLLTTWMLVNVAIGYALYNLLGFVSVSIVSLFLLNIACAGLLYKYIKAARAEIGMPQTVNSFKQDD